MASFVSRSRSIRTWALLPVAVLSAMLLLVSSCSRKDSTDDSKATIVYDTPVASETSSGRNGAYQVLSSTLTIAGIQPIDGSADVEVLFNENAQGLRASGVRLTNFMREAMESGKPLSVSFDPWQGVIVSAAYATGSQAALVSGRGVVNGRTGARTINLSDMSDNVLDNPGEMGIINTTDPGLNNVIPDFTTAQLMFDYITRQCCAVPGPYAIDYCIPFQYCIDGCYARAHKMCWIINNRYKYGTKKIFSFAYPSPNRLCVQGQKWGGCCIRWWYHVAPLVTIQMPTGPKAYVFDPAMFNQPVPLSTWLHAQENPACAGSFTPNITMINVQPTSSYAPMGTSGTVFSTDPAYSATNNTLNNYSALITCP